MELAAPLYGAAVICHDTRRLVNLGPWRLEWPLGLPPCSSTHVTSLHVSYGALGMSRLHTHTHTDTHIHRISQFAFSTSVHFGSVMHGYQQQHVSHVDCCRTLSHDMTYEVRVISAASW